MRRCSFRAIAALVCFGLTAWVAAQEFGPEWIKEGHSLVRKLEVEARRSGSGNAINYAVKLETAEVSLYEETESRRTAFQHHPYGEFDVQKSEDGTASGYEVTLGEIFYQDLNGDGFFDAMSDRRGLTQSKSHIFLDGRFVEVARSRGGIGTRANSPDRSTNYFFENGSWHVSPKDGEQPARVARSSGLPVEQIETQWVSAGNVRRLSGSGFQLPDHEALAKLTTHWAKVIQPAELAEHPELMAYLNLVRPQPDEAFTPFTHERLSSELVNDSIGWMDMMLGPSFNPYANTVVTVVPERRRIGQAGPRLPSVPDVLVEDRITGYGAPGHDSEELSAHIDQARKATQILRRAVPKGYYLAPDDGLSLLSYEFDSRDIHVRIIESSAALLIRLRPARDFDVRSGMLRIDVQQLLDKVFEAEAGEEPIRFDLPNVIRTGVIFRSASEDLFSNYALDEHRGVPPDWSADIVGFATDRDLCLIVRKCNNQQGAMWLLASHWQEPHPDWLKNDLYQANGISLVYRTARGSTSATAAPQETTDSKRQIP